MYYDELKLYDGDDCYINKDIIITQPTLNQIKEFGEQRYWNAVYNFTRVGADLKWQLYDWYNIDYTQISDFDVFLKLTCTLVSSKKKLYYELQNNENNEGNGLSEYSEEVLQEMLYNPMELILKDIDFADYNIYQYENTEEKILYNPDKDIVINRVIYSQMCDVIRTIHGLKRNNELPGNERTKMDMIEDARDEAMAREVLKEDEKQPQSVLRPLVSALSVRTGQCGDERIMNMTIFKFLDNIKRASKIMDSELLLSGAYSGFGSLKGIDNARLDWTGNLD